MPQPLSGGQHPEGGGRGNGGDHAGPGGGGDGDDSGSGSGEAKGKGPGETSSEPKGSGGKRSDEKGSGGKGSGGKGSGGKGSGGKGSGGKGTGRKRRAFGSHESSGTESRCEGSRDSDMRDEAALRSYQVRVHSHLSARTLFHDVGERKVLEGPAAGVLETSPSEYDRYASEGASIDFKSKRVFETGATKHQCHALEGASVDLESKSTPPPGKGELSQEAHVVQREEETQHWPPHEVREGLDVRVFETGASEHQCHASEGASVDVESKSAAALGEEDLLQEAHAVQWDVGLGGGESHCEGSRDSNTGDEATLGSYQVRVDSHLSARTLFHDVEDSPRRSTQHACPVQDDTLLLHLLEEGERLQSAAASVQGPCVGVLETEASECKGHALEETHAVQRDEELLQGSSGNAINIGDTDLVLHSGSPLTTQEGDIKGG
ncbi:hypothetical protein CBR_g49945 [Chara braunii]|uniref:Uncharacterized protein n=1 Tax=Chara braunii TaxID=69332 RepID=A0A388JPD2_CHABU|nr:hypothetical protein CBR_g49945 [Chara braunii]|eukprot:GBG59679.1 hypothetical protein CBR_g49945 [Chara braunii]